MGAKWKPVVELVPSTSSGTGTEQRNKEPGKWKPVVELVPSDEGVQGPEQEQTEQGTG